MSGVYDEAGFFDSYAEMDRSRRGLAAAGEWPQFRAMFPPLEGKRVLDLGCGYGWHCAYAAGQGAQSVLGLDPSGRMLAEAARRNAGERITYALGSAEDFDCPPGSFDVVISNLALHYVAELEPVFRRVYAALSRGGVFLINIEHPTFTAGVDEDWVYSAQGEPLYWPVDRYFYPGGRVTRFLGHEIVKQHHTLAQILGGLLSAGFRLEAVDEARPSGDMLSLPGMRDELRRPMMLLIRASKNGETEEI